MHDISALFHFEGQTIIKKITKSYVVEINMIVRKNSTKLLEVLDIAH